MTDLVLGLKSIGETLVSCLPDRPRIALKRNLRGITERRRLARADLVVIGHPKSGNTWMRFQLARLYQRKYGLPESVIPDVEVLHTLDHRIPQLHMGAFNYIKHIVAKPAPAPELSNKAVVFIVRHPLDIMVSLYLHVQKHALHERKLINGWPLDLSDVSMADFALHSSWGLRQLIAFFNDCARQQAEIERSRFVSYEDMRVKPAEILAEIAALAGGPVTGEEAREAAEFTSFDKLRQAEIDNRFNTTRLRAANPKDPDSFKVRRAKVFGYRDYFQGEDLGRLEALVNSELDPRFGYGQDAEERGK
jgi:hypothetical protein